jgi:hypothetical protein
MKHYHLAAAAIGLVLAASAATTAGAQRYDDYGYGNDRNSLTLICWGEGRRPSTSVSGG